MPITPSGAEPQRSEPPEATTPRATSAAETIARETASPSPLQAGAADPRQPGGAQPQEPAAAAISTEALIEQLQADRLWLLRQIDAGAYPELRLDLAALERELGQLLDQAGERFAGS